MFLIIEERIQCENICNNTSMSKLNIIDYGGSTVQYYSDRVTHLICVTQKHILVEQVKCLFLLYFRD